MAEKKKNAEQKPATESVELTAENIMDTVKAKNLQNESTVKAALDEIEKETDEKKKREAKHAILKCQYRNAKALISLRQRRAEEKVTKEHLTDTKTVLDEFLGGKLTPIEMEKKSQEIDKKEREAMNKISNEFNDNIRELRNAYPGHWCWEWD